MVKEILTDKMLFETRFTKEREQIWEYTIWAFQAKETASSGLSGENIFDMYKEQEDQTRSEWPEEEW